MASLKKMNGKYLNDFFGIGAKHALFREDGGWYHQLKKFPGVLFDARGYVLFLNRSDYLNSKYLRIRKDLNVPGGISSMPSYKILSTTRTARMQKSVVNRQNATYFSSKKAANSVRNPKAVDMPLGTIDIRRALNSSYRILRDTKVSKWVKFIHKFRCQICGTRIQLGRGKFYSEAHHIQPLGRNHRGPDVPGNLLCLCPNHHALLDYGVIPLIEKDLLKVKSHVVGDAYIRYHNSKIHRGA
jgi:5-methylcytosine-specific restriction protein A